MDRRVVCAAIRIDSSLPIVCGPRHFDQTMYSQLLAMRETRAAWSRAEQGFIDQHGVFLTREQAWPIAEAAGQIIRRCGGDGVKLFSENLY